MDDEAATDNEALKKKTQVNQRLQQKQDNPAMSSSSAVLVENNPQNKFILLQKSTVNVTGNKSDQTPTTRIPVQISQALQQHTTAGQTLSIMRPQVVHKVRPADPRALATLNHRNLIPVQLSKGQAIIINPVGQTVTTKYPILPKGASPEKQLGNQAGANQVLVPISRASGINSSTTLTVRPIAPRLTAAVVHGNEVEKKPRLQSQPLPRAIAPQPPQIMLPPQVCQASSVVQLQQANNIKSSSMQTIGNLRFQGPSGQVMQAVIAPVQMRSSLSQEGIVVNSQATLNRLDTEPMNGDDLVVDTKPVKKPCNCTKSQCLKLYCDCFANGEFCNNCNCHNCSNNIEHEAERSKAIKSCLERNPNAFHPKIGKTRGVAERRHTKGCHCKRSGCLKNYCECYEAKIMCSALCKCTGCKNFEESPERKTLMHLADAAEVRVLQQNAARSKLESQLEAASLKPGLSAAERRLPFTFITTPVVNATCECMMARAEEAELNNLSQQKAEKLILEEFGRSLLQIIQVTNRSKDYNA